MQQLIILNKTLKIKGEMIVIISGNITPGGGVFKALSDHIAELDAKIDSKANLTDIPTKVSELDNDSGFITSNNSLSQDQIYALNEMFKKCAFTSDVSKEYESFKRAFGITADEPEIPDEPIIPDKPEILLTGISVIYSGESVLAGTDVIQLTGITVSATYSDGTTSIITDYTLSGSIAEGTNTITVSYNGKTATFEVVGFVESTAENLMTTGELGIFSGLNTYTGYTGYYDADVKTLQLTPRSAATSSNAHMKITPFVEIGKTYTLFVGVENRNTTLSSAGVDYSKKTSHQTNYLNTTTVRKTNWQYIQFTVPEDAVEVYLLYSTTTRTDTTISNVALYEGALTEMP